MIYPPTLQPVFAKNIPLKIRNTFNPTFEGTIISNEAHTPEMPIKGISSIQLVALVNVQGSGVHLVSLRHGCESLNQLEILDKPPMERADDNPWPEWPKLYFLDYGQEEAQARFGDDPRDYCVMTKKFTGDEQGYVKRIHLVTVKWEKNQQGHYVPVEVPGTEKVLPADLVLLSMGYLGPESQLLEALGIETNTRSNINASYGTFTTNVEKVFAAGDARRGQSLVVWAINEGRAAARECDKFLMGQTYLP